MDDMKDKFKGFMKRVNTQLSSSSSGKFKGQGRVLGGGSSSTSGPPSYPIHTRYSQQGNLKPTTNPSSLDSSSNSKPLPPRTSNFDEEKPHSVSDSAPNSKPADGFDPFDSLITTGKRSRNGYTLNVFECPICGQAFGSEEETSIHVESCVNNNNGNGRVEEGGNETGESSADELRTSVGTYLSGKPQEGSVEVVLRLLKNIVKEPENAKFRKIRMTNPKIRETISDVPGGVELLECVGFELKQEDEEMWAFMEVPGEENIRLINKVIGLLEPKKVEEQVQKVEDKCTSSGAEKQAQALEEKKIDRQIRVFFAVPENVAARIELPDSFYNLSLDEIKREADARKKKIADSQLLIPKSYKEKQAKAARKKYRRTLIRIQFPDGVVLQGVFAPWETTCALYEFVSTSLKDPSLEFDLVQPLPVKRRVIPHFPNAGEKRSTLDDEELVPSALIKFRPIETDESVFTGLRNELLEISEPLT